MRQGGNNLSTESPIISKELRKYLDKVGYNEPIILRENREETKNLGAISIMQTGAAQGALISIICRLSNFKNCLEIGTFTGYSSICIANSISTNSRLTVIDNNKQYLDIAKKYWDKISITEKITVMNTNADEALDKLQSKGKIFDFVFIDADKSNYVTYFNKVMNIVNAGSLICIDNTLWKGKVYDESNDEKTTKMIRELNDTIKKDKRVVHSLLTIYDGMTLCYVK